MNLIYQNYQSIFFNIATTGRNPYNPEKAAEKIEIEDSTEFSCGSSIEKSPKSFHTECSRKSGDVHVIMAVSLAFSVRCLAIPSMGRNGGTASFCAV